jgi:hypothetical protein
MKNTFNIYNKVFKNAKTEYGVLTINHIVIDPDQLESLIVEMIFDWDNLEFVFSKNHIKGDERIIVLNRFLPPAKIDESFDYDGYVEEELKKHTGFYSFLGEALMAIALKDIFGYQLSAAILDVENTINDSHTGADGCLYDSFNNKLIIGEAKFRNSLNDCFDEIENNFSIDSSIENKLNSFYNASRSNPGSRRIILQSLKTNDLKIVEFHDFLKMELIMCGFATHNSLNSTKKYLKDGFYDRWGMTNETINENIKKRYSMDSAPNYTLYMFHIPIKNKQELIVKVIKKAHELMRNE